jgi:FkbM family methyltransferase
MSAGIADRSADAEHACPAEPGPVPPAADPAQPAADGDLIARTSGEHLIGCAEGGTLPPDAACAARLPMRASLLTAGIMAAARWTHWLEAELLGLAALVEPGSVCVDVGAAAGIYTLPLARLAGPSGLVHSVEPLPFAWPAWNRVLDARRSPNVRHHAVALGSEPGQASMSVPRGRYGLVTGRSFISQHCRGLGSNAEFAKHITYPVAVKTLDGLIGSTDPTRLDFVKIDVEGAELHVLRGGAGVIEAFRPAMLIEIEARHTARYQYHPGDVADWLARRGYAMYTWEHGWQPASAITSGTRNYLFRAS